MTKEAFVRESRRSGVGKSVESNTVSNSTAPWDQPRNGTTITLEGRGVDTCTMPELLAWVRQRHPDLKDVQIDHVNSQKPGFGRYPATACLLISWANPSFKPLPAPANQGRTMQRLHDLFTVRWLEGGYVHHRYFTQQPDAEGFLLYVRQYDVNAVAEPVRAKP